MLETVAQFLKCRQTAALVSTITASGIWLKQNAWQKKLESGLPITEPETNNWDIGLQGKSPACFVTTLCLLLKVSQWMMTSSLIHSSCMC